MPKRKANEVEEKTDPSDPTVEDMAPKAKKPAKDGESGLFVPICPAQTSAMEFRLVV